MSLAPRSTPPVTERRWPSPPFDPRNPDAQVPVVRCHPQRCRVPGAVHPHRNDPGAACRCAEGKAHLDPLRTGQGNRVPKLGVPEEIHQHRVLLNVRMVGTDREDNLRALRLQR